MNPARAPVRALVLCAGLGERLRPLTEILPKPLLPVLGRTALERTLGELAAAGVEAAAINLHHLGGQIREHLGERFEGMQLHFSFEKELLGTLGPFGALRKFFSDAGTTLLVNGDSLCRWPVAEVLEAHSVNEAVATLLVSSYAATECFGGGVQIDAEGRILAFRDAGAANGASRRGVFAGLHVIDTDLVQNIETGPSDIVRDLYEPMLDRGEYTRSVVTGRRWHDLGTPSRYLEAVLAEAEAVAGNTADSWLSESVSVASTASIQGSVLEQDVSIDGGAEIARSVALPGAHIGRDTCIEDSIIGPGVRIPDGSTVSRQMVVRTEGRTTRTEIAHGARGLIEDLH